MKKLLGFLFLVIIIAILVIMFLFGGFGFGFGSGDGDGDSGSKSKNEKVEATKEDKDDKDRGEEIPDEIIVKIDEDKVTINGIKVEDADALKVKVNEYNSDSRTFRLEQEYATVSTYEWVKGVFDDLEIYLKE